MVTWAVRQNCPTKRTHDTLVPLTTRRGKKEGEIPLGIFNTWLFDQSQKAEEKKGTEEQNQCKTSESSPIAVYVCWRAKNESDKTEMTLVPQWHLLLFFDESFYLPLSVSTEVEVRGCFSLSLSESLTFSLFTLLSKAGSSVPTNHLPTNRLQSKTYL